MHDVLVVVKHGILTHAGAYNGPFLDLSRRMLVIQIFGNCVADLHRRLRGTPAPKQSGEYASLIPPRRAATIGLGWILQPNYVPA